MVADELRRQADVFLDIVELQSKIGRDPGERTERPPREPREPRERASATPRSSCNADQRRVVPRCGTADDDFDED